MAAPPPPPQAPAPAPDAADADANFSPLDYALYDLFVERNYGLEKFSLYRNGDPNFGRSLDEIMALRDAGQPDLWDRIVARNPSHDFNARFTDAQRVNLQRLADVAQERWGRPGPPRPLRRSRIKNARLEVRRAGQMMDSAFRFIKHLGTGGQGMASLWEYRSGPRQLHRLVLKVSNASIPGPEASSPEVPDTTELQRERAFLKVSLCLHIAVQILISRAYIYVETSSGTPYPAALCIQGSFTTFSQWPHRGS